MVTSAHVLPGGCSGGSILRAERLDEGLAPVLSTHQAEITLFSACDMGVGVALVQQLRPSHK